MRNQQQEITGKIPNIEKSNTLQATHGQRTKKKDLKNISLHANVNTTYQNLWDVAERNERNHMYHILQKNKYLKSKIEVFILHHKRSKLSPKSSAEV